jgi:DNA-binding LacI/PurR family transcriptional regulator
VRQNGPEMVDCALDLLQKRWREGPTAEGRLRLISGTLVERKTTANS